MKQFLTFCMAAAMVGTSFSADAKLSLERARALQGEGKMIAPRQMMKGAKSGKSLRPLKNVPASKFHRLVQEKDMRAAAMKAPQKVTAKGDNIYGYLCYADDDEIQPVGLYEFQNEGASLLWTDYNGLNCTCLSLDEGLLKGYVLESFWGMIFGIYYVEYDFASGDLVTLEEQDLESDASYIQGGTLNTESGEYYGFGVADGTFGFVKISADNHFAYELVSPLGNGESCLSFCYNDQDHNFYGVNGNYDFVKFDTAGNQTVLSHLNVPGGASYLTGLVYDAISNRYYWNINLEDGSSQMATIDGTTYALDIYEDLYNGEEYISMFTTDVVVNPDKPDAPVAVGTPDFYKNSLIGFVSFQLPSSLADGTPIEGEVKYNAYLDGELYSVGSAEAGSVVEINYAAAEGMHTFGLAAVNNGVESRVATVKGYVGNDVPLAPANVALTDTEVTWNAVTGGVHGGYVDLKALTYNVSINGKVVAEDLTETSLDVASFIPADAPLAVYTAKVVAVCNGLESSAASSNGVLAGEALELPQYIVPTPEQYAMSVVLDNNGDGQTWVLSDGFIQTGWSDPDVQMDDWYFLPPMKFESVEKFYSFSFDAARRGSGYINDYVEVLLCNEASPRGVVETIVDEFVPNTSFDTYNGLFKVRQPGEYYIAIHCTSDGDQYGIQAKNFSVEDNNVTLESPVAVDDLTVEAAPDAKLEATVSFTMPSETLGETAIPADAVLTAVIKGEQEVTVTGAPGEKISEVFETAQGNNTFTVVVSYDGNNSVPASATVYTGYNVPSTVAEVNAEVSADNYTMTLTWEPVTTGYVDESDPDGGLIDPATVVYDIYTVQATIFGNSWVLYDAGLTETSYVYSVEDGTPQEMVQIGVVARNEAGDNGYLSSATGVLGVPYELPMGEDFDGEEFATQPWITYSLTGSGTTEWGVYDSAPFGGVEDGSCIVAEGIAGSATMLGLPKFTTKGVNGAVINLNVCAQFYLPVVTIYAEKYGSDLEAIGEVVLADEDRGFHKVSIELPAEYLDQEWVALYIYCEFVDGDEAFCMEDISIDKTDKVSAVSVSDIKIAAGKNSISVSGLSGQDVMVTTVDGRIAAKALKAQKDAAFSLEKGVYVVKAGDKKAKVVVK